MSARVHPSVCLVSSKTCHIHCVCMIGVPIRSAPSSLCKVKFYCSLVLGRRLSCQRSSQRHVEVVWYEDMVSRCFACHVQEDQHCQCSTVMDLNYTEAICAWPEAMSLDCSPLLACSLWPICKAAEDARHEGAAASTCQALLRINFLT